MTFEIEFKYQDVPFKADVTPNGKDYLVNLVSPVHYETAPTMVFTIHDDGSMKYDQSLFDDNGFMPTLEAALQDYIRSNNISNS
jgi:hypothetical protein